MVKVNVQPTGREGWVCEVTIEEGGSRTEHSVRVSAAELDRWGRREGEAGVEDLVRRSFAFLLERESPGSILRRFDLSDIQRYFSEFDDRIKR